MADRRWMASCLWLSLIVTCGSLQQILASESEPEIVSGKPARRVCYYQAATVYRPRGFGYRIEDIPGDLCSHIIYAFADISGSTWEVKYSNESVRSQADKKNANINSGMWRSQSIENIGTHRSRHVSLKTDIQRSRMNPICKKYVT
ncbi:uncharacterized protein LOC134786483 [Penaeus indicus]|uniref:uncharacterized protein LOC134786483 n=1 Tax=Penaeus indicus TaxID=29960 RepID=UPI00300C97CF